MKLRRVECLGVDGWFHRWYQFRDGNEAGCYAIVEHKDGTVHDYHFTDIVFLDTPLIPKTFKTVCTNVLSDPVAGIK